MILEDQAYENYCIRMQIPVNEEGTIVLNEFWDSLHSSFRHREYVPFVGEKPGTLTLWSPSRTGGELEVPVAALTEEPPILKEEYEDYALVHEGRI